MTAVVVQQQTNDSRLALCTRACVRRLHFNCDFSFRELESEHAAITFHSFNATQCQLNGQMPQLGHLKSFTEVFFFCVKIE